jgi:hypothetical protein
MGRNRSTTIAPPEPALLQVFVIWHCVLNKRVEGISYHVSKLFLPLRMFLCHAEPRHVLEVSMDVELQNPFI